MRKSVPMLVVLSAVYGSAFGHGGGLNAEGCHRNHKTSDYHCHRALGLAPTAQSLGSIPLSQPSATAVKATPQGIAIQAPLPPTCHVGPRGGTYTITKSGKKNYSGC